MEARVGCHDGRRSPLDRGLQPGTTKTGKSASRNQIINGDAGTHLQAIFTQLAHAHGLCPRLRRLRAPDQVGTGGKDMASALPRSSVCESTRQLPNCPPPAGGLALSHWDDS